MILYRNLINVRSSLTEYNYFRSCSQDIFHNESLRNLDEADMTIKDDELDTTIPRKIFTLEDDFQNIESFQVCHNIFHKCKVSSLRDGNWIFGNGRFCGRQGETLTPL